MTTRVLILCPHNAAKSPVAAAYLTRAAADAGLDLVIKTAGTQPDDEVMPVVRDHLTATGHPPATSPRMVTSADLEAADLVVDIGCHAEVDQSRLVEWDIPDVSVDADVAFESLRRAADQLVASLSTPV